MHNSNDQGNTSNRDIRTSNICEMGREYRLNQKLKVIFMTTFHTIWSKPPTGENMNGKLLERIIFLKQNKKKNNNNIYDQITPSK